MIPESAAPRPSPTAVERRRRLTRAALVALFAAILVLPPVGARQIVTGDEARFAVLAQDMLTRGTWFDARVRGQRYRNKPLMYPWTIKLLSMPGGRVTETTAHLPIAVAAIAAVFFTALLGQQLFSARAGVWAGLIVATSYSFFAHSQILLPDMIVVAFGMAALSAFWAAMSRPPGTRPLVAFYACVALGVLAKGPMGILPLLIAVAWLVTEAGWRGLGRLASKVGALAFVVVSLAWLVPFIFAGGRTFVHSVVWEDWLAWYLGGPEWLQILNFGLEAAKGLVPWTILFVLPLLCVRRAWRTGPFRFVFLAWMVPFVIMMLSQNHRVRYLLPTYPAAALMIAWWLDTRGGERSSAVMTVAALSGIGIAGALVVAALPWLDPAERAVVAGFWWKAGLMALGTLALAAFMIWALLRRPAMLVPGVALGMALLLIPGVWIYTNWTNRQEDYRGLAALVGRHASGGPIGVTGGRFFSVDFYLGRALTAVRSSSTLDEWLTRPDRPIVLIPDRAWRKMESEVQTPAEVVDTMRVRSHDMLIVRRSTR
jgi:4-amino-4-deoxy-L-arabinose transferase-like glycosyltransferase